MKPTRAGASDRIGHSNSLQSEFPRGHPPPADAFFRILLAQSSLVETPGLLTTPTGLCATRLSRPGRDSDADDCLVDTDDDGIEDTLDNCRLAANPSQLDSDGDSWGNACDADLDDDGIVTPGDFFALMRPCFGADLALRSECIEADFDGDGVVGAGDFFSVFLPSLGGPPGPSGRLGE